MTLYIPAVDLTPPRAKFGHRATLGRLLQGPTPRAKFGHRAKFGNSGIFFVKYSTLKCENLFTYLNLRVTQEWKLQFYRTDNICISNTC